MPGNHFLGIALPETPVLRHARRVLGEAAERNGSGVRVVPAANLHLTLRYLGPVQEPALPGLCSRLRDAIARVPAFSVALGGPGRFSGALWVAAVVPDSVTALVGEVDHIARDCGLKPDPRPFLPHVTVARLAGRNPALPPDWPDVAGSPQAESVPVREFTLYRSEPGRAHSSYIPVDQFPLSSVDRSSG